MLAKLGFSVISQVEPDILIIDEVLAVGDIAFQAKCIQTIRDFKKRGVTILFVSHNMSDVEKSAIESSGSKIIDSEKWGLPIESLNCTSKQWLNHWVI